MTKNNDEKTTMKDPNLDYTVENTINKNDKTSARSEKIRSEKLRFKHADDIYKEY